MLFLRLFVIHYRRTSDAAWNRVCFSHGMSASIIRNPLCLEAIAMSLTLEQLEAEAMKLTPDERADLADRLWVSVTSREEVATAWDAEIARRVADMDAGNTKWISMEEVMTKLRARIKTAETHADNA